jgi:hypothetical protein
MVTGLPQPESPLEDVLRVRIARLQAGLQGLSAGLVAGLVVVVATLILVLRGGPVVGPHLALLGQFMPGYRVSLVGSLVGFGWGFAYGFVAGWLVSALYNVLVALRGR